MRDRAANVFCPRCGYDQRGVTASWRESCPLHATCAECGLTYPWAEVLSPDKFEPRWCVEYCPAGEWRFLRSCASTLARSFLPWRFWARLKMSDRIRPKRVARYLAILLLPLIIFYLAAQTFAALHVYNRMQRSIAAHAAQAAAVAALAPDEVDYEQDVRTRLLRPQVWFDEVKQRPDEWAALLNEARRRYEHQYAWATDYLANPMALEGSASLAVIEAIFTPYAARSHLTLRNSTSMQYPAPYYLWDHMAASAAWWFFPGLPGPGSVAEWIAFYKASFGFLAFGMLLALLFPISFAMLPASRRKAKVRWAHIGRISAYGAFIPAIAFLAVCVLIVLDLLWLRQTGVTGRTSGPLVLVSIGLIPLGTTLWWLFAINRHLRMPRALAITATLMFVCFLAALAIVYYTAGQLLFPMS